MPRRVGQTVTYVREPDGDGNPRVTGSFTTCDSCGGRFDEWSKDSGLWAENPERCPLCGFLFDGKTVTVRG